MGNRLERLASYLSGQLNLNQEDREVVAYGLEVMVSTALGLVVALLLAMVFGVVKPVLAVLLVFVPIRKQAGGAHGSTMKTCTVMTAMSFTLLGWLTVRLSSWVGTYTFGFLVICFTVSLVANHLWAPSETPNKPIGPRQRMKLRRRTFTVLLTVIAVLVILAAWASRELSMYVAAGGLALLAESLVVSPLGKRLIEAFDHVLLRVINKKEVT